MTGRGCFVQDDKVAAPLGMRLGTGQGIEHLDVVYVVDIQSIIMTNIGQCP